MWTHAVYKEKPINKFSLQIILTTIAPMTAISRNF